MLLSKIKPSIVSGYNYLVSLLPIKWANQLLWVHREIDWSISIYEGTNCLKLKPTSAIKNPVLSRSDVTDTIATFVADPFMVRVQDDWLMFFEVLNYKKQRGEIAFAKSKDGCNWNYQHLILSEDFHLSYPYVFEFESNWYMIPETCEANSVRLYQAKNFPTSWEFVKEILVGSRFVDASILNFNGIWWLFVGVEPTDEDACNRLELYYADRLLGDWVLHPHSPIIDRNREISRPAGRIQHIDNQLIRFAQNCTVTYGYNVTAIEIELLTTTDYTEAKMQPDGAYLFELGTISCNSIGMHHLDFIMLGDRHCIACVDSR